jgi:putative ABC transport system substrate-binding protein
MLLGAVAAVVGAATASRARAQRAGRTARIGVLLPGALPIEKPFVEALGQLGYRAGDTVLVERRSAEGDFQRLPALAIELAGTRPDVIVAFVTQASIAAKRATASVPIVMVAVADPVAAGLVSNLARPEGNVTGTAAQLSALVAKQVELIRDLRPGASRLAVMWNPANAAYQQQAVAQAREAAGQLGMRLRLVEARSASELERAFAGLGADPPEALLVLGEPLFVANATRIGELLRKHRLLAVGGSRNYLGTGMVAIHAPDLARSARRAAPYVDKILRGAKPADLPVELETRFELVVDLTAARTLGVAIPSGVLARCDEVVQ